MITEEMITQAAFEIDQAILDSLPDPSECTHVFSASFEKKIQRLIFRAKHYVAFKVLKRVACIFVALLVSASMFLAFNPEARAAIVTWIEEKVGEFYHYFFVGDSNPDGTDATRSTALTDATVSSAPVLKEYMLGWVPDGYTLIDAFEVENGKTSLYINETGLFLQFNFVLGAESNSMLIGGGEYTEKQIIDGSLEARLYMAVSETDANVIIWSTENDNVLLSISAFDGEDALIKMAQNVQIVQK